MSERDWMPSDEEIDRASLEALVDLLRDRPAATDEQMTVAMIRAALARFAAPEIEALRARIERLRRVVATGDELCEFIQSASDHDLFAESQRIRYLVRMREDKLAALEPGDAKEE